MTFGTVPEGTAGMPATRRAQDKSTAEKTSSG